MKVRVLKKKTAKVWRTVAVGGFLSFQAAVVAAPDTVRVGFFARNILEECFEAVPQYEIPLVRISVNDLVGQEGGEIEEVFSAAEERGLFCLPAHSALQVRTQYTDQPEGESLILGIHPVEVSYKFYRDSGFSGSVAESDLSEVFRIYRNEGSEDLRVGMLDAHPDRVWRKHDVFVFTPDDDPLGVDVDDPPVDNYYRSIEAGEAGGHELKLAA